MTEKKGVKRWLLGRYNIVSDEELLWDFLKKKGLTIEYLAWREEEV